MCQNTSLTFTWTLTQNRRWGNVHHACVCTPLPVCMCALRYVFVPEMHMIVQTVKPWRQFLPEAPTIKLIRLARERWIITQDIICLQPVWGKQVNKANYSCWGHMLDVKSEFHKPVAVVVADSSTCCLPSSLHQLMFPSFQWISSALRRHCLQTPHSHQQCSVLPQRWPTLLTSDWSALPAASTNHSRIHTA